MRLYGLGTTYSLNIKAIGANGAMFLKLQWIGKLFEY